MSSAASTYFQDQFELDECLNFGSGTIHSSIEPRWKRKAAQASNSNICNTNIVCKTPYSAGKRSRATITPGKTRTPTVGNHDRFIPSRSAMNLENAHFNLMKENSLGNSGTHAFGNSHANSNFESPTRVEYNRTLANTMGAGDSRVLAFKNKAPAPPEGYENSLKVLYTANQAKLGKNVAKMTRHIPSAPERILDAPEIVDDYYLNLLDWGSNNMLAVALGQTVYLWNAETGNIDELCTVEGEDDYITSVKFVKEGGGYLAVGNNYCETKLWDIETSKLLRSMDGHTGRVSSLSWNEHVLTSAGRDTQIINHDVRIAQHQIGILEGHIQEVCGLSWSPDGQTLASGGNDNLLCLWDARFSNTANRLVQTPRLKINEHMAAVKGLAWCPHQRNVLASGGGTADRSIKIWNAANGACLNSMDTGSQVCSLLWNPHEKELLSSHGFSENQLCLWKYPSMVKTKELSGHTARVLHLAGSPDGTMVCSAAADETLRLWKVFEPRKSTKPSKPIASSDVIRGGLIRNHIR